MNYGYIYKTTNLINNMFYIGQRKGEFDLKYFGSGKYLENAIKKYKIDNFIKEIVCYAEDRLQANILERKHIRENRIKYGKDMMYNIKDGGEGAAGPASEETKIKMRQSHNTPERLEQNRLLNLGNKNAVGKRSKECKKHISEGTKLAMSTLEIRKKISLAHRGKPLSLEHKQKIKENCIPGMRGRKHSQETKRKMRLAKAN